VYASHDGDGYGVGDGDDQECCVGERCVTLDGEGVLKGDLYVFVSGKVV